MTNGCTGLFRGSSSCVVLRAGLSWMRSAWEDWYITQSPAPAVQDSYRPTVSVSFSHFRTLFSVISVGKLIAAFLVVCSSISWSLVCMILRLIQKWTSSSSSRGSKSTGSEWYVAAAVPEAHITIRINNRLVPRHRIRFRLDVAIATVWTDVGIAAAPVLVNSI